MTDVALGIIHVMGTRTRTRTMAMAMAMAPLRATRAGHHVCAGGIASRHRPSYIATASLMSLERRAPRIAHPSFWTWLIPRFLRRPTTADEAAERARRRRRGAGAEERRVGLTFLVLGIVVGSNAINMIGLQREMLNFSRETDAKLHLLRGVVSRVRNGEEFDVKKALGTGDAQQEKEWEHVVQELEKTDTLWEGRNKREAKRADKAEERRLQEEESSAHAHAHAHAHAPQPPTGKTRAKFLM